MPGTFQGKVALVTGAAFGLGRASAIAFAREGAKVVIADIDTEKGPETEQIIKKAGGEALFVKTDVSKAAEVEAMVNKTVKTYGRLDCAHNNVGIEELPSSFADGTEELWNKVIDVDLKGIWLCMKYELRHMAKQGSGAIVNTSSIAGLVGIPPGAPIYAAAKHGVIGLTRNGAVEYARKGIRINVICPAGMRGTGFTQRAIAADPTLGEKISQMVPLGRDADPAEVAEAVIWLCSDAASYVVGAVLSVDGGFTTV